MATLTLPFLRIVWMITQEKSNVNSFLSYGYSAQRYPDLNIFLRRRGKTTALKEADGFLVIRQHPYDYCGIVLQFGWGQLYQRLADTPALE